MDDRQAKLTSVDYLMVIATRLGLCSESKGMRIFQNYRHKLFYSAKQPAGISSKLDRRK